MTTKPEALRAFGDGLAGAVLDALTEAGHEARIVGGAVRDALMGRPVREVDVATTALPPQTIAVLKAAGFRAIPTGIEHGTVTAVGPGGAIEITTLRRDMEPDGRRARVVFGTDWRADAERRDFTINALSVDRAGGLHDPVGGLADIASGRLRFIGDPRARIAEDRLRAWRFLRFFAEIGTGAPDPAALTAVAAARPTMGRLSAERVAKELKRLIVAPRAVEAVGLAADTGLLVDVVGVPRPGVLARVVGFGENDPAHLLAALAAHIPEDAERIAAKLRLSGAERTAMVLLATHARVVEHDARRVLAATGARYPAVCRLASALSGAATDDPVWRARLALPDTDPVPAFPVRGADLVAAGVAPGPAVGAALTALERLWAEGDYRAGRDALIARLRDLSDGGGLDGPRRVRRDRCDRRDR